MTGETNGIGLAELAGLASLWAGAREARLRTTLLIADLVGRGPALSSE
jgi:hypothetical protein